MSGIVFRKKMDIGITEEKKKEKREGSFIEFDTDSKLRVNRSVSVSQRAFLIVSGTSRRLSGHTFRITWCAVCLETDATNIAQR